MSNPLTVSQTNLCFHVSALQAFHNFVGKEDISYNKPFSFAHRIFYPFEVLWSIFIKSEIFIWKKSKILTYHSEKFFELNGGHPNEGEITWKIGKTELWFLSM